MAEQSRYRHEDGTPALDISIPSIERLFDNRDPAPFRERDLDPDLVEYVLLAGEDLYAAKRYKIVFWIETPCQPKEIEDAFHAHFEYELDRIDRQRRRQRRTGQVSLMFAVVAIIALTALAQLLGSVSKHWVAAGLKEGLVISSWVLMWKPVEVLVYDWIPWRRERKVIRRMLAMPIDVRIGKGPTLPKIRHAGADGATKT